MFCILKAEINYEHLNYSIYMVRYICIWNFPYWQLTIVIARNDRDIQQKLIHNTFHDTYDAEGVSRQHVNNFTIFLLKERSKFRIW